MPDKKQKILLLFDLGEKPPKDQDYSEFIKDEDDDWLSEANIYKALKSKGHDVKLFGVFDDIDPLYHEVKENRPDVVFNLIESFGFNRTQEPNVVSFLELLGLKYTGSGPTALSICKDKGLTKKILAYHHIRIPKFVVSKKSQPLRRLTKFPYPAFIKPLRLEASEGIAQLSFVENEKDALERIHYIHDKLGVDAIAEEFIKGREIYVSVLGNSRLTVFPPREIFFNQVPEDEPKFLTYKGKWDPKYRKKWGIRTGPAKPFPDEVMKKINEIAKRVYRVFQIRGYARLDLRVTPNNEVVFLEANPNPAIDKYEDYAKSAEKAGTSYEDLIGEIVKLAL